MESVEAVVLTAYTTLYVIGVLIASTILAGIGTKQNFQRQRRPKEDLMAPLYPRCPYSYRRMTKSGTTYKPTCNKCAVGKKNGRTRRHSRRRPKPRRGGSEIAHFP